MNSGCGPQMMELEYCLSSCFLPALFSVEVSSVEHQIFARYGWGGLGTVNPVAVADYCYNTVLLFAEFHFIGCPYYFCQY